MQILKHLLSIMLVAMPLAVVAQVGDVAVPRDVYIQWLERLQVKSGQVSAQLLRQRMSDSATTARLEMRERMQNMRATTSAQKEAMRLEMQNRREEAHMRLQQTIAERRETMRSRLDAMLASRREAIEKKWDERKVRLTEKHKERVRMLVQNMGERMAADLRRLGVLADKVEERMNTLEDRGGNVTEARTYLGEARAKLVEAETAFAEAKAKFDTITESDTPGHAFEEGRVLLEGTRNLMRDAHQALVRAVQAMKGFSGTSAVPTTP